MLSDANDALQFDDMHREKFIWVEDFTDMEALSYLVEMKVNLTESQVKAAIARLGTRPLLLIDLASSLEHG